MTVEAALDVLRAAGWDVRTDTGYGTLAGAHLVMRYGTDEAALYSRVVAQQPWTPTTPQEPTP